MGNLGLKGAWKKHKGARLRFRMREYMWDIRYAWQRAWRGYDNSDIFELGYNFIYKMPVLLSEYKKRNDCLFYDPDKNGGADLTKEEMDELLDRMIFLFENAGDNESSYIRLFGVGFMDDPTPDKRDRLIAAKEEQHKCYNEAMDLLKKWCLHLWY